MFTDILNALKFAADPQTRNTISAIVGMASKKQPDWKSHVHREEVSFTQDNWSSINAFTNELFRKVAETKISPGKFKRFITVYTELINNAYHHGCSKRSRWKIQISCVYSKWFIQLDVMNDGKGFDVEKALIRVDQERSDGIRAGGRSGLELVRDLVDSMYVSGKKSKVTVVIAGEERMKITTAEERLGKYRLLVVTWDDDVDWSFLTPDWEPLNEALTKATQPLILVRFGVDGDDSMPKPRRMKIEEAKPVKYTAPVTKPTRAARPVITTCALDTSHLFAYIISEKWVYDDFGDLKTPNLKFFRTELDARKWLLQTMQVTPN